jgi:hypothetical protein
MFGKFVFQVLVEAQKILNMPGIDTVELFIGEAGSLRRWHVEDLSFGLQFTNLQSGKPKFWVA